MNCRVRTIVRCCTYLIENTTYRKSVTTTTQSGSWTQVYRRTITSPLPIILYIDTILVLGMDIPRISQKGTVPERYPELSRSLVWMSCEKLVNSPLYLDTSTCNYNDNSSSISDSKRRYRYVKVGRTNASEVEDSCREDVSDFVANK